MPRKKLPQPPSCAYEGRVIWNDHMALWETPSEDVSDHVGATENSVIDACVGYRKGRVVPVDSVLLWRTAPEYEGKRKARSVEPLALFAAGIDYLRKEMLRPWPGLQGVAEALAKKEAEGPPPASGDTDAAPEPKPQHKNWLVINRTTIRDRAEMLNLTDMWRAAGEDPSKAPYEWDRSKQGREFISALATTTGISRSELYQPLNENGEWNTWAHWHIALAYAKYLSPEFHMACNNVVRNHMEGTAGVAIPANLQEVVATTVGTLLLPIMIKLGIVAEQNASLVSQNVTMLEMLTSLVRLKTKRTVTLAEMEAVWIRCSQIGSAKALMESKPNEHWRQAQGGIAGDQIYAAVKALQDGTLDQKIAERKARRKARRDGGQEVSTHGDDPGFEFDFGFDG